MKKWVGRLWVGWVLTAGGCTALVGLGKGYYLVGVSHSEAWSTACLSGVLVSGHPRQEHHLAHLAGNLSDAQARRVAAGVYEFIDAVKDDGAPWAQVAAQTTATRRALMHGMVRFIPIDTYKLRNLQSPSVP
jgi:hypothetical protein